MAAHTQTAECAPPPPPNPEEDAGVIPLISSPNKDAPSPPAAGLWDISSVAPETALKMLCRNVQALARITGDVPPTPPISRSSSPRSSVIGVLDKENNRPGRHSRTPSRPATPVSSHDINSPFFKRVDIEKPEASMHEPATADVGADAEPIRIQHEAIARKFYSKRPPPISLEAYLMRLQRYCPMSTAVWLAALCYIYDLGVVEKKVPVTDRTIHRLVLGTLRVAMKALEDLRYPHARFAGVGGVGENELRMLEISVCYLTDFDLQVNCETLYRKTMCFQQATDEMSAVMNKRLPTSFQVRLPMRAKTNV